MHTEKHPRPVKIVPESSRSASAQHITATTLDGVCNTLERRIDDSEDRIGAETKIIRSEVRILKSDVKELKGSIAALQNTMQQQGRQFTNGMESMNARINGMATKTTSAMRQNIIAVAAIFTFVVVVLFIAVMLIQP